jgi:hypothetical protein
MNAISFSTSIWLRPKACIGNLDDWNRFMDALRKAGLK